MIHKRPSASIAFGKVFMNQSLNRELLIEKDILLFLRYLTNLAKRLLSNPRIYHSRGDHFRSPTICTL